MAYNIEKLAKLEALKALAERVKSDYATKASVEALTDRVGDLETTGGEPNVITAVKVNGEALTPTDKAVNVTVATGSTNGTINVNGKAVAVKGLAAMAYKGSVAKSDLASALATELDGKAAKSTTLSGYGITDAYTKTQVDGKISSVYKPGGSKAFAGLPTPAASILGMVYNVTDAFTTTVTFVEGAGKTYPAGTNVVVVQVESAYKFDTLSGFVDLSPYATTEAMNTALNGKVSKVSGMGLSTNDYTTDEKNKLAGIADGANNYVHPSHTAKASGLYKVTVDALGHVSATAAVAKGDITALGIPAQDTTYSPATSSANGLMSATDKIKLDGFNVATTAEVTEMLNEVFTV